MPEEASHWAGSATCRPCRHSASTWPWARASTAAWLRQAGHRNPLRAEQVQGKERRQVWADSMGDSHAQLRAAEGLRRRRAAHDQARRDPGESRHPARQVELGPRVADQPSHRGAAGQQQGRPSIRHRQGLELVSRGDAVRATHDVLAHRAAERQGMPERRRQPIGPHVDRAAARPADQQQGVLSQRRLGRACGSQRCRRQGSRPVPGRVMLRITETSFLKAAFQS